MSGGTRQSLCGLTGHRSRCFLCFTLASWISLARDPSPPLQIRPSNDRGFKTIHGSSWDPTVHPPDSQMGPSSTADEAPIRRHIRSTHTNLSGRWNLQMLRTSRSRRWVRFSPQEFDGRPFDTTGFILCFATKSVRLPRRLTGASSHSCPQGISQIPSSRAIGTASGTRRRTPPRKKTNLSGISLHGSARGARLLALGAGNWESIAIKAMHGVCLHYSLRAPSRK